MKKIIIAIISLCVVSVVFSSCFFIRHTYRYEYDKMSESVSKIEMVYFPYLNGQEIKVLRELTPEEMDEFLLAFSSIKFRLAVGKPDAITGYTIKIYYENGDYEFISRSKNYKYDENDVKIASRHITYKRKELEKIASRYVYFPLSEKPDYREEM